MAMLNKQRVTNPYSQMQVFKLHHIQWASSSQLAHGFRLPRKAEKWPENLEICSFLHSVNITQKRSWKLWNIFCWGLAVVEIYVQVSLLTKIPSFSAQKLPLFIGSQPRGGYNPCSWSSPTSLLVSDLSFSHFGLVKQQFLGQTYPRHPTPMLFKALFFGGQTSTVDGQKIQVVS